MSKILQDIPLPHLYLYLKVRNSTRDSTIGTEELRIILSGALKWFGCPRGGELGQMGIVEEMEKFELVRRLNIQRYEILRCDCPKLKKLEQFLRMKGGEPSISFI